MGLVVILLINGTYVAELFFAVRYLKRVLARRKGIIYLIALFLVSVFLLAANLLLSVGLLNFFGADTEFVGFGFALIGALLLSVVIMAIFFIKEATTVVRRGKSGK